MREYLKRFCSEWGKQTFKCTRAKTVIVITVLIKYEYSAGSSVSLASLAAYTVNVNSVQISATECKYGALLWGAAVQKPSKTVSNQKAVCDLFWKCHLKSIASLCKQVRQEMGANQLPLAARPQLAAQPSLDC